MTRAKLWLTACLALGSALGCGPEFDPPSELKSLRVLGVQKDKPYAQPGDTVKLQMLWHDVKGRSDVQRVWLGGCVNPPGDAFYGCFSQYGSTLPVAGDSFEVQLPEDIISGRGGSAEPGQDPYGVYIVAFAVCAGSLSLNPDADPDPEGTGGLPVLCLDEAGEPLGSDDFVVGYSTIYSFLGVSNQNPTFGEAGGGVGQFLIAGEAADPDCSGVDCQGAADVEIDCDAPGETRCIKACGDDGDGSCPAITVAPPLDESIVEVDERTSELFGEIVTEQMWVNYYVDRGGISDARLVNDASTGWNPEFRGQLRAPKEPGPMKVWAVVHDNRGGMDFTRITLQVQ